MIGGMNYFSDAIAYIRKTVSRYFLNIFLMASNVLIGFYTKSYSIMFSALIGIIASASLYDENPDNINMGLMDLIVIMTILFPIGFLWFQHGHPTRIYAGLILLWGLLLFIGNKLYSRNDQLYIHPTGPLLTPLDTLKHPANDMSIIFHYLGSFGHLIFNVEWALLVLL
jgi:hypothetical protein